VMPSDPVATAVAILDLAREDRFTSKKMVDDTVAHFEGILELSSSASTSTAESSRPWRSGT
jgi:hypothetical protein